MDIPVASQTIRMPGYGAFWVANSIASTLLGWNNRRLQEQAHERNQEFQLEMERAQNITNDERLQEEIAFKRRMVALARQYRQEESITSFNAQMKAVELQHYLQRCWPLDPQLPYVVLKEIEKGGSASSNRLNVILMHAPLLVRREYTGEANKWDADIYKQLEYAIMHDDVPAIQDLQYRQDACVKADLTGGNASIMNIHFLMSQLPTLVISPHYSEGKMYFNGAVWEPQAARPMIRPLLSFDYNPVEATNNEDYRCQMIDLFHTAISIITGSVRDSYMLLTQGAALTMPKWLNDEKHHKMKQLAKTEPAIVRFIQQENQNILAALDERNTPHLLEFFSKEDIQAIKKQVESNHL